VLPPDIASGIDALRRRRPDLALDVRWYPTIDSTMNAVAAAAEAGVAAGLVVGADEQTAGRGRRGREWSSPPGAGLYFSMLGRPSGGTSLVTLAAGVAVRRGIEQAAGLSARLKWPNDVVLGSRKLAGILCEALPGARDAAVTIGVGVNLAPGGHPVDVAARAATLAGEVRGLVDRGRVLSAVIEQLIDALDALDRGGGDDILREWRRWAPGASGAPVDWVTPAGVRRGVTAGVDDQGGLLVDTTTGRERIIAGEVRWL
jgi:BirA family biotin operon repressor/biotin-[acetyl-CoA-carboxylase] ligase